ncbi:MAG TPA: cbb3-type cytochrome c oxidase subunit I [Phycisphaerales bacterium]|nr:cbb3-type cytochrome c oxidase subunit I [Phycisphaerales bacterium]
MATIDDRNANALGAAAGHGHDEGSYLTPKGGLITTIWDWATTVDHKKIGVMYMCAVLMMFFFGGVAALAVRTELLTPVRTQQVQQVNPETGAPVVDAAGQPVMKSVTTGQWLGSFLGAEGDSINKNNNLYNRAFTLHGAIMVFMVIVPSVPAALGNFFLPILIGAKDVAFPRLNLLSWYIYVCGSIFGVMAILMGGVDTGWTFYTPYSTTTDADYMRVVYMVLAAFILGFSSILTGLNFVVSVHKLRAPGMGWFDMPLFVWAVYATSILQVLATPVIGITLLLLIFERLFHVGIFDPGLGGDPVLFQHFFWFYSHPVVYVMILPGMAIINEIIPVHSHKKIFGYRSMAFASLGIAAVSFLVWGHHMFTSEGELAATVFSALTFLVAIPTAVKVFNWVGTLYKGSISLTAPMVYALIFLFLFTIGGLTGLPLATLSSDIHLHDSYFVVAHFHYVMMGGTIIAFVGGIHHWWPKMFGKMYNERAAIFFAIVVFIGFNLTFFTQFILGTRGMPRRYASYVDEFQFLHQLSTIGSYILGVGFMGSLAVFVHSLLAGKTAPRNPWGGLTLEWHIESPPTTHNFHKEPIVHHGPYDFETILPPGWDPKDYPVPNAEAQAAAYARALAAEKAHASHH